MRIVNSVANKIAVGSVFVDRFNITDESGVLTPDPTLELDTDYPDGTTTNHTIGDGTLTAVSPAGTYDIDILFSQVGDHFVTIKPSTGAWHRIYVPVGD